MSENILLDMKSIYPDFIISAEGDAGGKPLDNTGKWTLKVKKGDDPENWKIHDSQSGELFQLMSRGVPSSIRMTAGEFICTYKDIAPKVEVKDPIDTLKEGGFEIAPGTVTAEVVDDIEEKKRILEALENGKINKPVQRRPEPTRKDQYAPRNTHKEEVEGARNTEAVNLPAPIGVGGIVRPAVTAQEALAAWREFQELKKYIIERSDIQVIQGKNYVKKSGWRKFATFYNLTDRIVEETREDLGNNAFSWKMKVICTAPNGRQTEGVAICTSGEKKFSHPEHDVYTTCHTRAKNRAISDMIAAGEVSAEEMEA
jgi:hypothetical protein